LIAKVELPHRGRFQAQGGRGKGIEESQPWAQDESLTAMAGHGLLDSLHDGLGRTEQQDRATAFAQAHEFVQISLQANGVHALFKKSFPRKPNKYGVRVDVEVQQGLAFYPESRVG
jgi:hypothetical protein